MTQYLRVEGINLSSFVFDTDDISTIRGGGLLLLEATDRITQAFGETLSLVARGASVGLFRVTGEDATVVRKGVLRFLRSDQQLRHATFSVELREAPGFREAREGLLAEARWRQMRAPSLAFPTRQNGAWRACAEDRLRPAPSGKEVSESVEVRRTHGRHRKQSFYEAYSGLADLAGFTHDLGELAQSDEAGGLDGKMAVIYADGNGFGKVADAAGNDERSFAEYDLRMRDRRRKLLSDLFSELRDRKGFWSGPKMRFETLLWGGDELLWVVPAWEGWWTLATFFRLARGWSEHGNPLTHAAGLVFCNHKAPIDRIRNLAKGLAETAKRKSRKESMFAYAVLESFDHTGPNLDAWLMWRRPTGTPVESLVLPGDGMGSAAYEAAVVKEEFPRKQLFETVRALLRDGRRPEAATVAAPGLSGECQRALSRLLAFFGGGDTSWCHLVDLWDYVLEEE